MIRAAILFWIILGGVAAAQSSSPEIENAKKALKIAEDALVRASSGRARLAALGKAVSAHEIALSAYRSGLRNMAARESRVLRQINEDKDRLESLLAALQSLSQAPDSALLAFPGGPVAAARGAGLMAEISPVLDERITAFRARLDALRQLRSSQEIVRIETRGTLATLQELRAKTAEALRRNQRRNLAPKSELKAQSEAAARQAKNIDELAATLEGAALTDTGILLTFTESRGFIQKPVTGSVTAEFGDPDPWGRAGYGLTLAAPAYAQVSAPWDGTIRYAGPLIDYGQVVVLEPEKDTLIVLAGLGRVDRLVGETVLAGERLGDLGGPIPASDEFLLEATTDRDEIREEKLYIELRRGGQPVDPGPWFDLTKQESGG
ncbi:MAG: peptidoglycan DD-metalloendopeptidase family protein [Pseudomonadota bacterium]